MRKSACQKTWFNMEVRKTNMHGYTWIKAYGNQYEGENIVTEIQYV